MSSLDQSVNIKVDKTYITNLTQAASFCPSVLSVEFDPTGNSDEYEMNYKVCVGDVDSSRTTDYCFNGFMYGRKDGYFYVAPRAISRYIPFVNAKELFDYTVKEAYGENVDITITALDSFFQNLKLFGKTDNTKGSGAYKPEDLLSQLVNNFTGFSQKTRLGRLLYGEVNKNQGSQVVISDLDDFNKWSVKFTDHLLKIGKAFNDLMAHIQNQTKDGLVNTYIHINKTANSAFKSQIYDKIQFIIDNDDSGLSTELSINPFFNPVARRYFDLLINPKRKSHFGTGSQQRDFDNVANAINVADMIPNSIMDVSVIGNLGGKETDQGINLSFVASDNNKIAKLRFASSLVKTYQKDSGTLNNIEQALNNIDTNKEELISTDAFILPRQLMRAISYMLQV